MVTSTFLRLCSRAPWMVIVSVFRSWSPSSRPHRVPPALPLVRRWLLRRRPFDPCLREDSDQCDYQESVTMSSGVPAPTSCPPASPRSGPRSITQSAHLMTSSVVLDDDERCCRSRRGFWKTSSSFLGCRPKCKPVVGSSRISREESFFALAGDCFGENGAEFEALRSPPERC